MPVITCSQRTAKASQSQMMANSYMRLLPADSAMLAEIGLLANLAESPSSFSRQPENARVPLRCPTLPTCAPSCGSSSSARCRPPRATSASRRRSPARASASSSAISACGSSTARPAACSRPSTARSSTGGACKILDTIERGRGRGHRPDPEPARLAPRRRAARDRQAADRAADSVLQGRVPGDRRPAAALGPQARHDGGGPRPGLRARHARGFEPARPPDRRLPPRARAPRRPTSPAVRGR